MSENVFKPQNIFDWQLARRKLWETCHAGKQGLGCRVAVVSAVCAQKFGLIKTR